MSNATLYQHYGLVMQAIEMIREGEVASVACRRLGLPIREFRKIIRENDEVRDWYDEAQLQGNDALADRLLYIHTEESDPKVMAQLSSNIKWLLERRTREYSPKSEVLHTVQADSAIVAALARGRERVMQALPSPDTQTAASEDTAVVDADYVVIPSDEDISQFI